jgi:L-fuculose-phosphate aldolase
MTEQEIKKSIVETGLTLLEKKLVARTWGNISCRLDEKHFAITPSGLGYESLTTDDIPIFNMEDETWTGRKPSSEKRIHAACYAQYPEVNFVVHTHQDYATAIGLVGVEGLEMSEEEKALLGEIKVASYGLPGTKKLKKGVEEALKAGSKTILMLHHGAVLLGKDKEDAIHKAEVLEEVCKRAVDKKVGAVEKDDVNGTVNASVGGIYKMLLPSPLSEQALTLAEKIAKKYPNVKIVDSPLMEKLAELGGIRAQLDDMSQMLGAKLKVCENNLQRIMSVLEKNDAVLVKDLGCIIKAEDKDDVEALEILINKAGISKLYTEACGKKIKLGAFDCWLMRTVFKLKYSKKKNEKAREKGDDRVSGTDTSGSGDSSGNSADKSKNKKAEGIRVLKFFLFSVSAGVIEIVSETLLEKCLPWESMTTNPQIKYWVSYLIALILSVIWNFTFNRKFTFKSATNVPIAMLKVALFYVVFTPATTLLQKYLCSFDWGAADNFKGQLTTCINMVLNLTTEYLYDRFFVFRDSLDTNKKALEANN